MVRANIRRNSASPPPLSLAPLPPTPAHDAQATVSPEPREPTPFDELPMSHLISFPVLDSPTSPEDNSPFDAFHASYPSYSSASSSAALLRDAFDYYRLPTNPPLTDFSMSFQGPALKPQLHPHTLPDLTDSLAFPPPQQQPQQCIPTSHLFPAAQSPLKHASPPVDDDESPPPSASSPTQPPKKRPPRAAISTKDFVPPDVSGLSKREARLVKNRAAAFLSRQRKREEFETMEVRVAQLEAENARLLALTQSQSQSQPQSPSQCQPSSCTPSKCQPQSPQPKTEPADPSTTELAALRTLLAQSRTRTALLESELARLRASPAAASPSSCCSSSSDAGSPPLLSIKREPPPPEPLLPTNKRAGLFGVVLLCALPSLLALPPPNPTTTNPTAASRFSFAPALDWGAMDIDRAHLPLSFLNNNNNNSPPPSSSSSPDEAEFDVSFAPAARPGKIRVRIESPAAAPDPWDCDGQQDAEMLWDAPAPAANVDVALFSGGAGAGRRRVRIALKSGPVAGAEGGEWEVEVR